MDKKKNNKAEADIAQDEAMPGAELKADPSTSKKAVEVTADDLADEESGPPKEKKGKKGKGKKGKANEDGGAELAEAPQGMFTEFSWLIWFSVHSC